MKLNDLKNKVKDTSAKQKSITDHFPTVATTKENFSQKYAKWVVADNMPLKSGESSAFKEMIRSLNKSVTPPDYRSTIDILTAKKLQAMAKLKAAVKGKFFL
jgi:hypothetical protein